GRRRGARGHVADGAQRVEDLPQRQRGGGRPAGAAAGSFPQHGAGGGARRSPGLSGNSNAHETVEKNTGLVAALLAAVVSIGGLAEIGALMYQAEAIEPLPGVEPYPPLELAGRDVYVREGCYNSHSQMVRTLRF